MPNTNAKLDNQYNNLDLNHPDAWCTECAVNIGKAADGEGKLVVFSGKTDMWPGSYNWGLSPSDLNLPLRNGQIDNFAHHTVYTDGKYIFDAFVDTVPIP